MTTFGELTQQVKNLLHSHTQVHERVTWLTSGCSSGTTSLSVADGNQIAVGVAEIGEELIYVSSSTATALTVAPFGRGYNGTTPAAHNTDEKVTFNPVAPTAEVKRAINQTLLAVYPQLYRVREHTFTFTGTQAQYELPSDCEGIIAVQWEMVGASGYWPSLSYFQFDPNAEESTGKAIVLHEAPDPGRSVRVVYKANFAEFASDASSFDDIGFPESALDVLLYGAAAKLIRTMDPARIQLAGVENLSRAQLIEVGSAGRIADQFYRLHLQRLDEERRRLLELNPPKMFFTR